MSKTRAQNPKVVARIGPYEEWPPLPDEESLGPLRVGSEGMLAHYDAKPVLWSSVRRLYVTTVDLLDGDTTVDLRADVEPDGESRVLETGSSGDAFDDRARRIEDLLLRFFVEHGIDRSVWPEVDLVARPERGAAQRRLEQALGALAEYEAVCPVGEDPTLGRYVEMRARRTYMVGGLVFSVVFLAGGWAFWVGLMPSQFGAEVNALLGLGMLAWFPRVLYSWLRALAVRDHRLRVGMRGLEIAPGLRPTGWEDVRTVAVDASYWLTRITLATRSTEEAAVFELAFLPSPVRRNRAVALQALLYLLLEAGRMREWPPERPAEGRT